MGSQKEVILTGIMGIALLLFSFTDAWAQRSQGQGPKNRALVCHHPGTLAQKTMVVDANSLKGHLGHGDEKGPCGGLFDAHGHPMDGVSIDDHIAALRGAGITGLVLFDREDAVEAHQRYPYYVYPFVMPQRAQGLVLHGGTINDLTTFLGANSSVRGIGELTIRHPRFPASLIPNNPGADHSIALAIYDLAVARGLLVNFHVDHNSRHQFGHEVGNAAAHNRDAMIIWSHVGDTQPEIIGDMMRRHPNLYADISTRNPFYERGLPIEEQSLTQEDGALKEGWRRVFEEFPERFLFGLDVDSQERLSLLQQVVAYYDSVLAQLTPETAEKIANGNIRRLLRLE